MSPDSGTVGHVSTASRLAVALLILCFGAASILAAAPAAWTYFVAVNVLAGATAAFLWYRGDVNVRTVVALALLFRLFYLWLPPVLSDDAFRYVWDGLVQSRGLNPYAYTPDDPRLEFLHGEAIYHLLNSTTYFTVYPPISQLIFRFGAVFHDAGWMTSYYAIKGLLVACEAAALIMLSRQLTARRLVLYAWNPLVVLAAAAQPHTESAAVLFLVLAWTLAHRYRGAWAAVALTAAGFVKLYPFVLLPLLWRRFGWTAVWPSAITAVALIAPYYHPDAVSHVLASLDLYVRSFEFNAGVYYGVKKLFEIVTGSDWSKQIGPAFRWLFLASLPAVYVLDWRTGWSFRRSAVVVLGLFFVFSTTVHPWYLVPLLVLVAASRRASWHWHWLGLASIGTYLLYVGGPYWTWVAVGWGGWAALGFIRYADDALAAVMRFRARRKADLVERHMKGIPHASILDLGAGEGYVAREIARRSGAEVTLVDVRDMNRTDLPIVVYEGRHLPFEDDTFDVVMLVYVLHHAAEPADVISEARRVCRRRIIVVESIYRSSFQRFALSLLDRAANHLRSHGEMKAWRETLHFHTFKEWKRRFEAAGLEVLEALDLGGWIHRRAVFVLEPAESDR